MTVFFPCILHLFVSWKFQVKIRIFIVPVPNSKWILLDFLFFNASDDSTLQQDSSVEVADFVAHQIKRIREYIWIIVTSRFLIWCHNFNIFFRFLSMTQFKKGRENYDCFLCIHPVYWGPWFAASLTACVYNNCWIWFFSWLLEFIYLNLISCLFILYCKLCWWSIIDAITD